jgi:CBS domain-containing protein
MLKKIAVGDIMNKNLVTVKPSSNLYSSAKELIKHRVNTLLVVDKKKLKGILTSRDILWAIIKKPNLNLKNIQVTNMATKKIAVIKPSADIGQAFQKMKKYAFRRLPVLLKGEPVGMITLSDILKIEPTLYQEIDHFTKSKSDTMKFKNLHEVEEFEVEGICEECDSFATLEKMDGKQLCVYCRDEYH